MTTPRFTHKELIGYLWFGIVLAAVGFLVALIVPEPLNQNDYWYGYKICGRGAGWLGFLVGIVWTGLSLGHLLTDFFSLEKSVKPDQFVIGLIGIGIVSLVLAVWLPAQIHIVDQTVFRNEDQAQLGDVRAMEASLRTFVQWSILLAGLSLASFPAMRFFKK